MFPIPSFTASLGQDGNIDIFALALSPQAQPGQGVLVFRIRQKPVFRIRQKKAGGEWQPWATAGKPGHGAVGVRSITDSEGHEMLGTSQRSSQHSDPGTLRRMVLTSGWPTTEGGTRCSATPAVGADE